MIKIYSTPNCPFCIKVKDFLKAHNVEFEDFNVAEDEQKRDEMVKKSGQMAVPVLDIDGEIIIGYEPEKIKEKLNLED